MGNGTKKIDKKILPEAIHDLIESEIGSLQPERVLPKFFERYGSPPDAFFINLDEILLPLACKKFEELGVRVAGMIAAEYGASITLLHDGKRDPTRYVPILRSLGVKKDIRVKVSNEGNPPRAILKEINSEDYQLLVMPSRRRLKLYDRLMLNSVSRKILHQVPFNVLQVYPPRSGSPPTTFRKVGMLLPRSVRDVYLLYWGNALLGREGELLAYHVADLPGITPLRRGLESNIFQEEKRDFELLVKGYAELFSTDIKPIFLASHSILRGIKKLLKTYPPDIVLLGQSRKKRRFGIRRLLSEKLLDKFNQAMIVHHFPRKLPDHY